MDDRPARTESETLLKGWREIAGYFGRDVSTVRRWAAERSLPVYRIGGANGGRGSVHAFAGELEAWLRSDKGRTVLAAEQITQGGPDDEAGTEESGASVGAEARPFASRRGLLIGSLALASAAALGAGVWWSSGRGVAPSGLPDGRDIPAEARDLYLRGTYLWNRRTPEGITGAIEALTRALEIYPDYAEAHASLAMTYNLARQYTGMSGWDAYPLAERHAQRAVELAPGYAFGQSVLAFVEFHWLWQVQAGLDRFETARRLEPNDANNLLWYASSLIHVLRYTEALDVLIRAQELDPGNTTAPNFRALCLHALGRKDEAIALLDELIRNDPDHAWHYNTLAQCRLMDLDYAGFLENVARVGDRTGVARDRIVAEAGLAALRRDDAQAMSETMAALHREYFERGEALAWDVAMDHAMVGNWQEAVPMLRISLDRHEERLIGVKYNTAFWPIRNRPEYRQLLADVGLPPDWPSTL